MPLTTTLQQQQSQVDAQAKAIKLKFGEKAKPLDIIMALRHLAVMLKSGLALSEGLQSIATQSENPAIKKIFTSIFIDVQAGRNLTTAMSRYKKVFTHLTLSMIRIGEESGTLEKNLIYLAGYLKKEYELNKKVSGALMYPIIVLGMSMFEMAGVVFFILPKLEDMFEAFGEPPAMTMMILNVTGYMRNNITIILSSIILFFIMLKFFLRTKRGIRFKHTFLFKFPVIKDLTRKNALTTISRTINILLESGIPIASAIKITGESLSNTLYQEVFSKIEASVKSGDNIANSFQKYPDFFPPTFTKMIQVGEQTGSLEENLTYLYEFYADEVDEMSNNLATLLEPMMLIFIGVMVGLLAMMIVAPLYQMTGSIGNGTF